MVGWLCIFLYIWKEKKITRKVLVSPSRQLNIFQINSATVFDLKSMEKSIYLVVKQEKKDEHNIFNSNSSIMKIMKMMVIYFKEREKKQTRKWKISKCSKNENKCKSSAKKVFESSLKLVFFHWKIKYIQLSISTVQFCESNG